MTSHNQIFACKDNDDCKLTISTALYPSSPYNPALIFQATDIKDIVTVALHKQQIIELQKTLFEWLKNLE